MTDVGTPPGRRAAAAALRFAAYLALALATHTSVLYRTVQCDGSLYLRYAQDWAAGARLYVDRYDNKTPVMFWLHRAAVTSNPRAALYLLEAGLAAAAAFELHRALAGPAPQAAPVAAVLLIAWPAAVSYTHTYGQFVIPIAALTAAWLGRAVWVGSAVASPAAAGAAFAVAAGVFPPAALTAAGFVPLLVWNVRRNGWKTAVTGVGGFALGSAGLVGAVVAHAWAGGYLGGMFDMLAATRGYASVSRVTPGEHLARWADAVAWLVRDGGQLPLFVVTASVLGLVVAWRRLDGGVRAWVCTAALWLLLVNVGGFVGGRHFTHYYLPAWAPLAVLAGLGLAALPDSRPLRAVLVAAFALTAVGMNVVRNYPQMASAWALRPDGERYPVRVAAAWLNQNVGPDETLGLWTWDRMAELHWQVRRPGPSRHVIPFNLAETRPDYFAEWAEDVLRAPPLWIATDNTTVGPKVTDDVIRARSAGFGGAALANTPAFDRLRVMVRDEYELVIEAAELQILKRKPAPK